MTINTDLTPNELKAAMVLVTECLGGMGGDRPGDLAHDEYTWVDAKTLMAHGWNKNEAAGTFGALMEKGWIDVVSKTEWALATEAWQHLDTLWDSYQAGLKGEPLPEETPAEEAPLTVRQVIAEVWKPGKIRMPVYMTSGVEYLIVEKTDLVEHLRQYAPDAIAPWQFLEVREEDDARYLDTPKD